MKALPNNRYLMSLIGVSASTLLISFLGQQRHRAGDRRRAK